MSKKKSLLVLISLIVVIFQAPVHANDGVDTDSTKNWVSTGNFRLNFNQINYSNWTQGGENSFTGNSYFDYSLTYDNSKLSSISTIIGGYGIILTSEKEPRKNDDKLQISSKLGYTLSPKFKYSVLFDLKTQFSPGYKYPNDSVIVSNFFAPGYLTLSFGTDWTPVEYLSILISPASGKFTIVSDQNLANLGRYGVVPAVIDTAGNILVPGSRLRSEFGMNFVFSFNKEVFKDINLTASLELRNNYFAPKPSNRWNFDLDMETRINFTINKYFSSLFYIHLLYDDDVMIPLYDSEGVETGTGPRFQVKQHMGFGLSIKL